MDENKPVLRQRPLGNKETQAELQAGKVPINDALTSIGEEDLTEKKNKDRQSSGSTARFVMKGILFILCLFLGLCTAFLYKGLLSEQVETNHRINELDKSLVKLTDALNSNEVKNQNEAVPTEKYLARLERMSTQLTAVSENFRKRQTETNSQIDELQKNLKSYITKGQTDTNLRITELQRSLGKSNITKELERMSAQFTEEFHSLLINQPCKRENGLPYGGTCYITPHVSSGYDLTYDSAVSKCKNLNAQVAEIHSLEQQEALQNFLQERIPSSMNEIHLWVGMIYRHAERTLRFRSGKEEPISKFKWASGYSTTPDKDKTVIVIGKDGRPVLWNTNNSNSRNGVLCEKPL